MFFFPMAVVALSALRVEAMICVPSALDDALHPVVPSCVLWIILAPPRVRFPRHSIPLPPAARPCFVLPFLRYPFGCGAYRVCLVALPLPSRLLAARLCPPLQSTHPFPETLASITLLLSLTLQ
ncbi:hypothetical protein C8R47DRAFT_1159522 [Mycena vitilis]|nr:hypothetical protein C8R47DRAFT_1159522 [Mycena vitilis]